MLSSPSTDEEGKDNEETSADATANEVTGTANLQEEGACKDYYIEKLP